MSPSSPGFRPKPPRRPDRDRPDRSEPDGLGGVLDELLQGRPWRAGVRLGDLARRWELVVGDRLAEESVPVALEGGGLIVRASSAAWAAQLGFLAAEIRARANEALGEALVREVRIVVARDDGTRPAGRRNGR